jgi:hypothetical protein
VPALRHLESSVDRLVLRAALRLYLPATYKRASVCVPRDAGHLTVLIVLIIEGHPLRSIPALYVLDGSESDFLRTSMNTETDNQSFAVTSDHADIPETDVESDVCLV